MKNGYRFQKLLLMLFIVGLATVFASASFAKGTFVKLDAEGKELPDDAAKWAIVLEKDSGLYWEVKTDDDSIHSNKLMFTYQDVGEKFIAKLNEAKFGGFSDWRLPSTGELSLLKARKKNDEARIDLNYFPHTMPSRYMSHGWCGSRSEYQEESIKFGKQKKKGAKYVMAFRGQPLE